MLLPFNDYQQLAPDPTNQNTHHRGQRGAIAVSRTLHNPTPIRELAYPLMSRSLLLQFALHLSMSATRSRLSASPRRMRQNPGTLASGAKCVINGFNISSISGFDLSLFTSSLHTSCSRLLTPSPPMRKLPLVCLMY